MAAQRAKKSALLLDCSIALVADDEDLVEMRLEQKDVFALDPKVLRLLLTKELATKMHAQLIEVLKITRH